MKLDQVLDELGIPRGSGRQMADSHFCKLFIALVGITSKGRKGAARGQAARLLGAIDGEWLDQRIATGLSSGKGLIWAMRDPIYKAAHGGLRSDRARNSRVRGLRQKRGRGTPRR